MPTTPKTKRPKRTKLKPVRFSEEELIRVGEFLGGRDFSSVVRGYILGEPTNKSRNRNETTPPITCNLTFEFSSDEWASVSSKIAGLDLSAVVRSVLLDTELPHPKVAPNRKILRKQMTEAEAAKIRQLAWIGNNLNQIARRANAGAVPISILEAIISLEREIRRVADAR